MRREAAAHVRQSFLLALERLDLLGVAQGEVVDGGPALLELLVDLDELGVVVLPCCRRSGLQDLGRATTCLAEGLDVGLVPLCELLLLVLVLGDGL